MAFLGGLLGGGLKIEILLEAPSPDSVASKDALVVPMLHAPSWKLRKNPFWRVGNPMETTSYPVSSTAILPLPTAPPGSGELAYEASQDIKGKVVCSLPHGKKVDHLGIKIQFIGRIDLGHGIHEGLPHYDFISLSKELSPPGSLSGTVTEVPFLFRNVEKEHESYVGRNVSVRYFVKLIMERKFLPPLTKERLVWIQSLGKPPEQNEAIKMEVGIEDCLHIEFEYEKRAYHLQDTIVGTIHFLLVRIKIKHMELAVIRRETSGEGVAAVVGDPTAQSQNMVVETQTLVKYEIMDGCPFAKDVIPVRLQLAGIPADLTPTYTAVNNRFSVRYYLNLVLVDEEDRRYFKQQEIILWRQAIG